MFYSIFPPIGIARLGNSPSEFFIGPEYLNSPGLEVQANGTEVAVANYKTANFQVKRQASRFRLYEADKAGGPWRPAKLPAGAKVSWSVRLANKKDGVVRDNKPPDSATQPIVADPSRADRIIDSQKKSVQGANAAAVPLVGSYKGQPVTLGELRTDAKGNLLVLGGAGITKNHDGAPLGSFYTNPGWHDDVADGPVTASILLPGGLRPTLAAPAWVIVAPPDFAPGAPGVVTLYDVIHQAALDATPLPNPQPFPIPRPAPLSFITDILPIIRRARGLQWVNDNAVWSSISADDKQLADKSEAAATLRNATVDAILEVETALESFSLCAWQKKYLEQYRAGKFTTNDLNLVVARSTAPDAHTLTRAALDGGVGQGFFPGIEAGIVLTDMSRYAERLGCRLDHAKVGPGDLTALMAQPWQADFYACNTNWWPSQRPNQTFLTENGARVKWNRGVNNYQDMVNNAMQLGVVTPVKNAQGKTIQLEKQRNPGLPG